MMKTTTSSQANEWTNQLVAAACEASKASMGEVNSNYVVGVLSATIRALLLSKKAAEAETFIHNELNWLKTPVSK